MLRSMCACVLVFLTAGCGSNGPGSELNPETDSGNPSYPDAGRDVDAGPDPRMNMGPRCADDERWAFCESFDQFPTSPQPFSSDRMDLVVGENDFDAIINGQTITTGGMEEGTIEVGYGPNCEPPNEMIRTLHVDTSDALAFQRNTRPELVFVCNGRLATTVKTGYGIISLMPRQLFDWSDRTGVIELDANLYSFGRQWWDMYLMPESDEIFETATSDEGGTGEQRPRRAILFSFRDSVVGVQLIDNYEVVYSFKHWQRFPDAFPDDPALSNPDILRKVRFSVSATGWRYEIEKEDGTFWTFEEDFPMTPSFSTAFVKLEQHSYNPTKDGIPGTPWSRYTYSWDNFRFDGPVIVAHRAFDPGVHFVDMQHQEPDPNETAGVTINVDADDFAYAEIMGHVATSLQNDDADPQNTAHWRQIRVNGGEWLDMPLVKRVPTYTNERRWSTFRLPIENIVPGENRIDFRYPVRPPMATWQDNGFLVKDIEIRVR